MAKMEMLKEAELYKAAARFVDYRQLLRKDGQALDNTKSVKEVAPKNALETLIRHFTDTRERKREGRELTDIAAQQVRRAECQSIRARDYSVAVDRILDDYCRVAGVTSKEVAPNLNAEEIARLRDFSDRLSAFSGLRKEFTEAARQAEQLLEQREADQTARTLQESQIGHERAPSQSPSPSQPATESDRSDRDNFSRGR